MDMFRDVTYCHSTPGTVPRLARRRVLEAALDTLATSAQSPPVKVAGRGQVRAGHREEIAGTPTRIEGSERRFEERQSATRTGAWDAATSNPGRAAGGGGGVWERARGRGSNFPTLQSSSM